MPRRRRPHDSTSNCSHTKERPLQRNAANARERARMRVLSRAFCRLKTTLPWVPPDTKLSKLDTLRLATSYIAHLRAILSDEAAAARAAAAIVSDPPHPLTLTWPFSFTRAPVTGARDDETAGVTADDADELEDDDDDDEEWSRCSSSDVTSSGHVGSSEHRGSFLASHFSDALMDIG